MNSASVRFRFIHELETGSVWNTGDSETIKLPRVILAHRIEASQSGLNRHDRHYKKWCLVSFILFIL